MNDAEQVRRIDQCGLHALDTVNLTEYALRCRRLPERTGSSQRQGCAIGVVETLQMSGRPYMTTRGRREFTLVP